MTFVVQAASLPLLKSQTRSTALGLLHPVEYLFFLPHSVEIGHPTLALRNSKVCTVTDDYQT